MKDLDRYELEARVMPDPLCAFSVVLLEVTVRNLNMVAKSILTSFSRNGQTKANENLMDWGYGGDNHIHQFRAYTW